MSYQHAEKSRIEYLMEKLESGVSFIDNKEAAELFLCFASQANNARELYGKISEDSDDACAFFELSADELRMRGVPESAIFLIKQFPSAVNRLIDNTHYKTSPVTAATKSDVQQLLMERIIYNKFIGLSVERALLILLDSSKHIIYCGFLSSGNNTSAIIDPAQICSISLRKSAQYALLAHNHPSGVCLPSRDDLIATRRVYVALNLIGTILVDHYIVTRSQVKSVYDIYNFRTPDESYHRLLTSRQSM